MRGQRNTMHHVDRQIRDRISGWADLLDRRRVCFATTKLERTARCVCKSGEADAKGRVLWRTVKCRSPGNRRGRLNLDDRAALTDAALHADDLRRKRVSASKVVN